MGVVCNPKIVGKYVQEDIKYKENTQRMHMIVCIASDDGDDDDDSGDDT